MKITIVAALVLASAFGTVVNAQSAASSTASIPAADMKLIGKCKAMKADVMTKSAMCTKMARLYPDQFANTAGSNG